MMTKNIQTKIYSKISLNKQKEPQKVLEMPVDVFEGQCVDTGVERTVVGLP